MSRNINDMPAQSWKQLDTSKINNVVLTDNSSTVDLFSAIKTSMNEAVVSLYDNSNEDKYKKITNLILLRLGSYITQLEKLSNDSSVTDEIRNAINDKLLELNSSSTDNDIVHINYHELHETLQKILIKKINELKKDVDPSQLADNKLQIEKITPINTQQSADNIKQLNTATNIGSVNTSVQNNDSTDNNTSINDTQTSLDEQFDDGIQKKTNKQITVKTVDKNIDTSKNKDIIDSVDKIVISANNIQIIQSDINDKEESLANNINNTIVNNSDKFIQEENVLNTSKTEEISSDIDNNESPTSSTEIDVSRLNQLIAVVNILDASQGLSTIGNVEIQNKEAIDKLNSFHTQLDTITDAYQKLEYNTTDTIERQQLYKLVNKQSNNAETQITKQEALLNGQFEAYYNTQENKKDIKNIKRSHSKQSLVIVAHNLKKLEKISSAENKKVEAEFKKTNNKLIKFFNLTNEGVFKKLFKKFVAFIFKKKFGVDINGGPLSIFFDITKNILKEQLGKIFGFSRDGTRGFTAIIKNVIKGVKKGIQLAVRGLKVALKSVFNIILKLAKQVVKVFYKALKIAIRLTLKLFVAFIRTGLFIVKLLMRLVGIIAKQIFNLIKFIVRMISRRAAAFLQNSVRKMTRLFKSIAKTMSRIFKNLARSFKNIFKQLINVIKSVFAKIKSVIRTIIRTVTKTIKRVIGNILKVIAKTFKRIFSRLFKFIKSLVMKIVRPIVQWVAKKIVQKATKTVGKKIVISIIKTIVKSIIQTLMPSILPLLGLNVVPFAGQAASFLLIALRVITWLLFDGWPIYCAIKELNQVADQFGLDPWQLVKDNIGPALLDMLKSLWDSLCNFGKLIWDGICKLGEWILAGAKAFVTKLNPLAWLTSATVAARKAWGRRKIRKAIINEFNEQKRMSPEERIAHQNWWIKHKTNFLWERIQGAKYWFDEITARENGWFNPIADYRNATELSEHLLDVYSVLASMGIFANPQGELFSYDRVMQLADGLKEHKEALAKKSHLQLDLTCNIEFDESEFKEQVAKLVKTDQNIKDSISDMDTHLNRTIKSIYTIVKNNELEQLFEKNTKKSFFGGIFNWFTYNWFKVKYTTWYNALSIGSKKLLTILCELSKYGRIVGKIYNKFTFSHDAESKRAQQQKS